MSLLEVHNITKRFSGHTALEDVSITVPEKSIFGLLGPNGAGKTTLIRIINQITAADEGKILFGGRSLQADDIYRIGYLPEERGLYKKMKVGEQALYLAQLKGLHKSEATRSLKEWFEKFEILGWWNRKVEELSKGMQQKVQFVITVLHNPKLLIFDEPFSGFDPINVNLLKHEILRLKDQGATIIFSTHNMSSVEELCDNIALINKSKKILEGEVDEIKRTYRSNTFQVEFESEAQLEGILPDAFELLSQKNTNGYREAVIRMPQGNKPNDLLKTLIGQIEIHSFREILPTMNDIFIETVKKAN
jgi:ABC-2 type transport system ATP-binding protein